MADNSDLGVGGSGVSGQMADDLRAMGDQAKRVQATRKAAVEANAAQGLKAATTGQGDVPPPLDVRIAGWQMQTLKDKDGNPINPVQHRDEYMKALNERIAYMVGKAADVQKSGTGNIQAQNTYLSIADHLKRSLSALQAADVGLHGGTPGLVQSASQPVGGQ